MRNRRSFRVVLPVLVILLLRAVAVAGPFNACPEYVRYGIPSDKGDLLCRKGYALAHNPERKTADWVAERLTREKVNTALPRSDDFRADPDLEPGRRAELSDYRNSGFDRGHMAPAANMRWDERTMSESFFLSNMSPQIGPGMNRGIWARLEELVRKWAVTRAEVYVFTGPIYAPIGTPPKTIGSNRVAVPSHFYKIVFDPVRVEAIAFVIPNRSLNTKDLPNFIATVRDVETVTGLNFLSEINEHVQELVETVRPSGLWE